MSNTPRLLPCPFCGGAATAEPIDQAPGWYRFTVLHSGCFYTQAMDQMVLNNGSLEVWNRRTPQPAREPLSLPQIAKAFTEAGLDPDDYPDDVMIEPLVRAIEHAHGITQNGCSNADT